MKRSDAMLLACPACKAAIGRPCRQMNGLTRKRCHSSRLKAAIKAMKPAKPKPPVSTVAADFYTSWAWKEARFLALKRHGRKCLCCGWEPGLPGSGNYLVVDHVKPVRTHPHLALDQSNLQVLCNDCNMGKSYKHHDDFR